jgi:uncharacterized repeat protein (TIGR03943 family)
MLWRYWFNGKLLLLLHPDYAWLSNLAAIVLLLLAALILFRSFRLPPASRGDAGNSTNAGHASILSPSISSALLLGVAILGLIYTPQAFASQTAIQRGISDTLTLTRAQPQRFVRPDAPEERTIIDWIRLVNVYPEPDAYAEEPVKVSGFVIHPEGWPANYVMLSRFVLTCCAADAYPVGLPVKLASGSRDDYPVDSWLEVSGTMSADTLTGRRQLTIAPTQLARIKEPKNPYEY